MVLPWIRKHAPKHGDEVVGQEAAVARLRQHIDGYRRGAKPLLFAGPPGTGKTSTVYALSEELDREVVEINASDKRNKASVNELLGAALQQQSLFFRGKIILVDEADGLSGNSDRGGVQALVALVKDASFPVIITVNDAEAQKIKALKKICQLVEFAPLQAKDLAVLLGRIAESEGLQTDADILSAISHRSGGDARAAVNDLQTMSGGGKVTKQDLEALGDREQKENITNALVRIFKTTSAEVALPAFDNVNEGVDALFMWIDANLPKEYTKTEDLARAFDALAEADKFFGRIRRWQYYRFYVYIYNLLSAGIALAKSEKYPGMPKLKRSSRPLMIWMANQRNAKQKAIAGHLAERTHTSTKRARAEVPFLRALFQHAAAAERDAIAEELDLSDDHVAWLRN